MNQFSVSNATDDEIRLYADKYTGILSMFFQSKEFTTTPPPIVMCCSASP